jgi:hypothetical protein
MAQQQGYSPFDAEQLFGILGVERPNGFLRSSATATLEI